MARTTYTNKADEFNQLSDKNRFSSGLLFLLPFVLAIAFFWPVITFYFTGEDFVFIQAASNGEPFYKASQNLFYRPVPNLIWQLDYNLWKFWAGGYHLTNLLLHLANVGLLLWLTLGICRKTKSYEQSAPLVAILAASIFAIHPAHIEPIAWAASRPDLLATLFFLLSLQFGLQYFLTTETQRHEELYQEKDITRDFRPSPQPSPQQGEGAKVFFLLLSLVTFGLGLFSKESAIALPLVLFGWLLFNWPRREWLKLVPVALLYLAVIIFYAFIRVMALNGLGGYPSEGRELIYIAWNATFGFWLPLVFPINVESAGLLGCIVIGSGFALTYEAALLWRWFNRKKLSRAELSPTKSLVRTRPVWLFALLIFYAGIVPVVNTASVTPNFGQSRIMYLSSVGFCMLVALLFAAPVKSPPPFANQRFYGLRYGKKVRWWILGSLGLWLGLGTVLALLPWGQAGNALKKSLEDWAAFRTTNNINIKAGDTIYYEGLPDTYQGAYIWRNGIDEASRLLIANVRGIHRTPDVIVDYRKAEVGRLWFVRYLPTNDPPNTTIAAVYEVGTSNAFNSQENGQLIQGWQFNSCAAGQAFPPDWKAEPGQGQIACETGKGVQYRPGSKSTLNLNLPPQTISGKVAYLDLKLNMDFDFDNPQALCEVAVTDNTGRTLTSYNFDIAADGKSHLYRLVLPLPIERENPLQINLKVNKIRSNILWESVQLFQIPP